MRYGVRFDLLDHAWATPGHRLAHVDCGLRTAVKCETVKNITVSVDDDLYRRARVKAAEQETSISALVKAFLRTVVEGENDFDRLAHEERELRQRVESFRAADRVGRDRLHERR